MALNVSPSLVATSANAMVTIKGRGYMTAVTVQVAGIDIVMESGPRISGRPVNVKLRERIDYLTTRTEGRVFVRTKVR